MFIPVNRLESSTVQHSGAAVSRPAGRREFFSIVDLMKCTSYPRVLILIWVFLSAPVLVAAQQAESSLPRSVRSATVTTITSEIRVDGFLEEREWVTAPKIGELTQREPVTGASPTEKTEVTLLHDADFLYIGVLGCSECVYSTYD